MELSEEEQVFRNGVRSFADARVRALVAEMDDACQISADVIQECFEFRLMGVEMWIPLSPS